MSDIEKAAAEALAIAKGEIPAARIYHNGHFYVPQAEVEQLRAEVKKYAMDALLAGEGNLMLHEENQRLRAALREIADADLDYASGSGHESAILTARAALGEKP